MHQVSEEYKELVYQEDVPHILNVYLGESLQKMNEDIILGLKITHNLLTSDEFAFGKTPAKMLKLQLHKSNLPDNFNSIYIETGVNEETVPIGYFTLESIQEDEDTITIKAIDNMIKFEVNYDGSTLEYPCNLMTVLTDICNKVGVELGSTSFLNADKEVAVYDNTVSARTYLSYIAEQSGGFAFIGRDGKLYIKTIGEDIAELPIQYFQDFKWGEQFKVSRVRYEDGVQLFEAGDETKNTIYINQENMYIVDQEQIDNIHDKYKDFNCYSFEGNSIIDPALDIGDLLLIDGKYVIYQGDMDYVGKFKANISSKIQAKTKEETMARVPSQKNINRRVESRINQVEGSITEVISEVDEQNQKVLKVEKTVDELSSKISEIAVLTKTLEGIGKITLDNTSNTEVQEFKITGEIKVNTLSDDEIGTYGTVPMVDLVPMSNLAPMKPHKKSEALCFSDDTYLTDFTLVHIKSDNTIEKILLPEFTLRTLNNIKDEFIITDGKARVIKKVEIDDAGFKYELKEPIIKELGEIHLILTEGEDIFYLEGFRAAEYTVTYMIKNDLTESFATKVEVSSEILQKADEVNISVDKKLSNYSTTTQINSAINVKANEITSNVSTTYATKGELNTAKSEIKQTTDSISSTVSKKVGNDEIISKINQSAEAVGISAKKIELSAEDVLNLLAGNAINLTSKNIIITSDFLEITKNGKMKLKGNVQATDLLRIENINGNDFAYFAPDSWGIVRDNGSIYATAQGGNFASSNIELSGTNGTTNVKNTGITTPKVTQTSLATEKKNFEKYTESALSKIKDIDIYKYNLKSEEDTDKKHIGFVIGKDYKYSKEVTSTDNQGVDNYSFTSLCCKAIQEQQELIEQLQNEIKELKGENNEKN